MACHKLILASSSPYLSTLVSAHPTSSEPLVLPMSKVEMTFIIKDNDDDDNMWMKMLAYFDLVHVKGTAE